MTVAEAHQAPSRPIGRAILILIGLGAFFYASYGFTNWLAGTRASVPSIVFEWEKAVPFLAWTILPYWSTNLFYAASILFSRTRMDLEIHAKRLLTAQLVAVIFFIIAPLKFSWPKPDTMGLFGFMFEALGAFDKPFNQAPSLHVALTVIFIARYAYLLPRTVFPIFLGWSVIVTASVMTTFQHHFIDIPTGALLGLFCLWLWRDDGSNALASAQLTRDPHRLRLGALYGLGALVMATFALFLGDGWLWLLWPAMSLLSVAAAYTVLGSALFMKSESGMIGWPVRIVLAPYLAAAWLNSRLWTWRQPDFVEIADGIHIGRYPDGKSAGQFHHVIDLAAEFTAPAKHARWTSFPMLDLVAPDAVKLRKAAIAIEAAQGPMPVLVCCALGYGRSAAANVVWLVTSGRAASIEEAEAIVRLKRSKMVINPSQMLAIRDAIHG
ncbi:MAG: phosphatase PAP2 family protein [Bosea sp. (in: a-proteobacteria)]